MPEPAAAAMEPPSPNSPLIGAWKGVYYVYPKVMTVEVEFQKPASGPTTGTLKFYPAVQDRSAFGVAKGSYRLTAQFDDTSRTFELKPGAWIERPNMGAAQVSIIGVFDANANILAGTFDLRSAPNPQFFLIAPGAKGEQLVTDIVRSAHPSAEAQQRAEALQQRANVERTMQTVRQNLPPGTAEKMAEAQRKRLQERQAARDKALAMISQLPEGAREKAKEAIQQRQAIEAPPNPSETSWSGPTPAAIVQWASRLKTEMPGMDLRNTTFDKLYLTARNLFEDDTFKPCFGITFEEMNPYQRLTVVNVFTRNAQQQLLEYQFLARPFRTVGEFGTPDITVSIHWQRSVRAWVRDVNTVFAALPAARASFASMTKAEAMAAVELAYLWPSERGELATTLAQTRTRLAVPVLNDSAASLIASAHDISGARDLASWDKREAELLQYAPQSDREQMQQRISTKLDALLEQLLAGELRALPGFGRGIAAVEAGGRWYQTFAKSYDFAQTRVPFQKALQRFRQARNRSLGEAASAITGKLEGAKSEAEIKSMLASYLSCPGDESTEAARAIHQLANQRLAYVKEQELLAMYSKDERAIMDRPGQLNLAKLGKEQPWAPSEEEVRLALLRGFAFGTGQMIDPHTAKMMSRMNGLLVPVTMIVRIDRLNITRFAYVEEAHDYLVEYTADMSFALPTKDPLWDTDPNLRQGGQMACNMANATAKLLAEERTVQAFHLYSDGWGVPELRQKGAGEAGVDAMLKGMMQKRHL